MKKTVNRIVIVGGGTAGWSTALNFLNRTDHPKITIIASKEIPIIGVGESSTGKFFDMINHFKRNSFPDEKTFLKETGSTFKLGIKHTDWKSLGESFTSPLGDYYLNHTHYPQSRYDFFRIYHVANKLKYEAQQSQLMLNNKLPFIPKELKDFRFRHVAYHLDTYKTGQYLKELVLKNNRVDYIDDIVVDGDLKENGILKNVILKSGDKIEGDLFVDCSGFYRVLIDKKYTNKFISYRDELLCNRAMPFHVKNKNDDVIKNYTHVVAKKYGWLWEIPLQERMGCGYCYSDDFITPDQAQEEIEKDLGFKIEPQKDIKFEAGRLEKFWIKNVLSTGLASAFIEPLEATSIHMTIFQIVHFLEQHYSDYMDFNCQQAQDDYNGDFGAGWDNIKDFIVLHYRSKRTDTEFWKEASHNKRLSPWLKGKLDIWKTRMPRQHDYDSRKNDNFIDLGSTLWYQILIGMDLLDPELAYNELKSFNLYEIAEMDFKRRSQFIDNLVKSCISTNDFYKNEIDMMDKYEKISIDPSI